MDALNLFSAAMSTVLAVVALWLSVVFYRMSSEQAARSTKNADEMAGSIKRLEVLFDRLYSDTFSMVRDTVGDMRTYIWQGSGSLPHQIGTKEQAKTGDTISEESLVNRIAILTQRLGLAEGSIAQLRAELPGVLKEAASELEEEGLTRSTVLNTGAAGRRVLKLVRERPGISFGEISKLLRNKHDEAEVAVIIFELGREKLVTWGGGDKRALGETDNIFPVVPKNGEKTREDLAERSPEG